VANQVIGRSITFTIYINAFLVGGVLMGYEMLGSRYLYPYFGGGIGTWAGLIAVVLCALTLGYFLGGTIADRHPSPHVIATTIGMAAIFLAGVPSTADFLMLWIINNVGDGLTGILTAATTLILVPVLLLGTLSPVAIGLIVRSKEESGRVAGLVYGISTIGNVFGTLFTTFTLIPAIGSRAITYWFTAILAACSASLVVTSRKRVKSDASS
jgi:hypothetical protein